MTGDPTTEQGALGFADSAQRGIAAALGCTNQAATQIARFTIEAMCDDGFVVVRKDTYAAMLAALQAYVAHTDEQSEMMPCCLAILYQTRAAISKATGSNLGSPVANSPSNEEAVVP